MGECLQEGDVKSIPSYLTSELYPGPALKMGDALLESSEKLYCLRVEERQYPRGWHGGKGIGSGARQAWAHLLTAKVTVTLALFHNLAKL